MATMFQQKDYGADLLKWLQYAEDVKRRKQQGAAAAMPYISGRDPQAQRNLLEQMTGEDVPMVGTRAENGLWNTGKNALADLFGVDNYYRGDEPNSRYGTPASATKRDATGSTDGLEPRFTPDGTLFVKPQDQSATVTPQADFDPAAYAQKRNQKLTSEGYAGFKDPTGAAIATRGYNTAVNAAMGELSNDPISKASAAYDKILEQNNYIDQTTGKLRNDTAVGANFADKSMWIATKTGANIDEVRKRLGLGDGTAIATAQPQGTQKLTMGGATIQKPVPTQGGDISPNDKMEQTIQEAIDFGGRDRAKAQNYLIQKALNANKRGEDMTPYVMGEQGLLRRYWADEGHAQLAKMDFSTKDAGTGYEMDLMYINDDRGRQKATTKIPKHVTPAQWLKLHPEELNNLNVTREEYLKMTKGGTTSPKEDEPKLTVLYDKIEKALAQEGNLLTFFGRDRRLNPKSWTNLNAMAKEEGYEVTSTGEITKDGIVVGNVASGDKQKESGAAYADEPPKAPRKKGQYTFDPTMNDGAGGWR